MAISESTKTTTGNAISRMVDEAVASKTYADGALQDFGGDLELGVGVIDGVQVATSDKIGTLNYRMASQTLGDGYRNVHEEIEDFLDFPTGKWTTGTDTGCTVALRDEAGGWLRLSTSTVSAKRADIRKASECYKAATGKRITFEALIRLSDVTNSELFIGLAPSTADVIDAYKATTLADGIFLWKASGSTALKLVTRKNGAETAATIATLTTSATWVGFRVEGGVVTPYVDGVEGTSQSSNLVDDEELAPHAAVQSTTTSAITLDLDKIAIRMDA